MQKNTDDNETMSDNDGRIGGAHDLNQSDLLLALRSQRESVFEMEATAMSLQLKSHWLVHQLARGRAIFY